MDGAHRRSKVQPRVPGHAGNVQPLPRVIRPARRRCRPPARPLRQRRAPRRQPALPIMYLLPTPHQAHHRRPAVMPPHRVQHVPRLRIPQRHRAVPRLADRVHRIPAALGLVHHHQPLRRRSRMRGVVVAERRQRLDHPRHPPPRRPAVQPAPSRIPHQRLPQHVDQGRVARQERRATISCEGQVQPQQRLPRARRPRHEHHHVRPVPPRRPDGRRDRPGGSRQPAVPSLCVQQRRDIVPGIQGARGADQRRHGPVRRRMPGSGIIPPRRAQCGQVPQHAREQKPRRLHHRRRAGEPATDGHAAHVRSPPPAPGSPATRGTPRGSPPGRAPRPPPPCGPQPGPPVPPAAAAAPGQRRPGSARHPPAGPAAAAGGQARHASQGTPSPARHPAIALCPAQHLGHRAPSVHHSLPNWPAVPRGMRRHPLTNPSALAPVVSI